MVLQSPGLASQAGVDGNPALSSLLLLSTQAGEQRKVSAHLVSFRLRAHG